MRKSVIANLKLHQRRKENPDTKKKMPCCRSTLMLLIQEIEKNGRKREKAALF